MCVRRKYQSFRIDDCLVDEIKKINLSPQYYTILCCCGHGRYPKTIIIKDRYTNLVFELFSGIILSKGLRKPKRYYVSDKDGYFFIPEIQKPRIQKTKNVGMNDNFT